MAVSSLPGQVTPYTAHSDAQTTDYNVLIITTGEIYNKRVLCRTYKSSNISLKQ